MPNIKYIDVVHYNRDTLELISDYFEAYFKRWYKNVLSIGIVENDYLTIYDTVKIIEILSELDTSSDIFHSNRSYYWSYRISIKNLHILNKLRTISYYALAYFTSYFGVMLIRKWLYDTIKDNILNIGKVLVAFKKLDHPESHFLTTQIENFLVRFLNIKKEDLHDVYIDREKYCYKGHHKLCRMIRNKYRLERYFMEGCYINCVYCNVNNFISFSKPNNRILYRLPCCNAFIHRLYCAEAIQIDNEGVAYCPNCCIYLKKTILDKYSAYCAYKREQTRKWYPKMNSNIIIPFIPIMLD